MRYSQEARLTRISHELASHVPALAAYLVGSRAREHNVHHGDYDVVVVMKAPLIPLYLRELKKIATRLGAALGSKVEVTPLPTFCLSRIRDNLFLRKAKEEARLLFGKDVLRDLKVNEHTPISDDCYKSYFAYLLKETMETHGTTDPKVLASLIRKIVTCLEWLSAHSQAEMSQLLSQYAEGFTSLMSSNRLTWFIIRDRVVDLFSELRRPLADGNPTDLQSKAKASMKKAKRNSILKNLEHAILLLLQREEIVHPNRILSRILVRDRYRAALILLSEATSEKGIDSALTFRAYTALKGCLKVDKAATPEQFWNNLSRAVLDRWNLAESVMGI